MAELSKLGDCKGLDTIIEGHARIKLPKIQKTKKVLCFEFGPTLKSGYEFVQIWFY